MATLRAYNKTSYARRDETMDLSFDRPKERCDRNRWSQELAKKVNLDSRTSPTFYQLRPEFEPLIQAHGPAPTFTHLGMRLIEQWDANLEPMMELSRAMLDRGGDLNWGPFARNFHHTGHSVTAHMCYLGTGKRVYSAEICLTDTKTNIAAVGAAAGLSREAATLLTEDMLQIHYVPDYSELGVITNDQRGWVSSGTSCPKLDKWLRTISGVVEYLCEAQRTLDDIVSHARGHRMSKRRLETISSYEMSEQLLCAVSPKWAELHNRAGTAICPELLRSVHMPTWNGRLKMLAAVMDKLVLCKLGNNQIKDNKISVIHASMTQRA